MRFPRVKAEGQSFYQCVSRCLDVLVLFALDSSAYQDPIDLKMKFSTINSAQSAKLTRNIAEYCDSYFRIVVINICTAYTYPALQLYFELFRLLKVLLRRRYIFRQNEYCLGRWKYRHLLDFNGVWPKLIND